MARDSHKPTDGLVQKICDLVAHKHLTLEQACAIVGINDKRIAAYWQGSRPRRPKWRLWWERAKAESVMFWIEFGTKAANEKNTAGVKFAEHMLLGQDKQRFSEMRQVAQAGIKVEIVQGATREGLPEVRVVQVGTGVRPVEHLITEGLGSGKAADN